MSDSAVLKRLIVIEQEYKNNVQSLSDELCVFDLGDYMAGLNDCWNDVKSDIDNYIEDHEPAFDSISEWGTIHKGNI